MTLNTGTGLGFTYSNGGTTFTSFKNGKTDPAALQVEFDIPVGLAHQPQGSASVRVWGIGLPIIGQASQLAGMNIVIRAGMQAGLPLANPMQKGIILEGLIYQSFGNWQGVNQTLDIVFNPQAYVPSTNVKWSWPANTTIKQAIAQTVMQAFPGYTADTSHITATLQQASAEHATFGSKNAAGFTEWAQYIQTTTQQLGARTTGNADYPGVLMSLNSSSKTIFCYDDLNNSSVVVPLNFQDLIGQPTWIGTSQLSFKTVLRADINIGNIVKFPAGVQQPFALTQTVAAPGSPVSSKTAFQGTFNVNRIQHFANFRQPDADSWNTTFEAYYLYPKAPTGTGFVNLPGFYD